MDFRNILPPSHAAIGFPATSKAELIRDLAVRLCGVADIGPQDCIQALLDREGLGSTGMGNGTAIPHARISSLPEPVGFVARLRKAIDFDAIDGRPVSLVCLLLLPGGDAALASEALAKASRRFRDQNTLKGLKNAVSNSAFYEAFTRSPAVETTSDTAQSSRAP